MPKIYNTNVFFQKVELEIEKLYNPKAIESKTEESPSVLSNISYDYLNKDDIKVNMNSYDYLTIYVRNSNHYIIDQTVGFDRSFI